MRLSALALSFALVAPAYAGPVADAGGEAERLAREGKAREAVEALDRARDDILRAAPLQFARLLFVAAEPQGYGVYEPRAGATFKPGETMYVYGEPFAFGHARQGDQRRIEFDVSLSVVSPSGETTVKPQSGKLALASRAENREFMVSLSYEPKGLPAGDYVLQIDVRDAATGKSTVAKLPFKVAG
jgi:hypothetical protein